MKKIMIAAMAVFLSAGCAAGGAADSSPELRIQNGQLQYQDESGNWNSVANEDQVETLMNASAESKAEPSEPEKTPHVKEISSPEPMKQSGTAIMGAKGDKGEKGNNGDKGETGPSGAAGKDGTDGTIVTIGADGELILNGKPTGYLLTKKSSTSNLLKTPEITNVEQEEHSADAYVTWTRIRDAGSYTVSCEDMQYTTTETSALFKNLSVGEHVIYITANPISGRSDYSTSLTGEKSFSIQQTSLNTPYISCNYSNLDYQNKTAALSVNISLSGDAIDEVQIYLDGEFITHTADLNYQIDSIDPSKDHQIRVVAIPSDKSRFTPSESTFTVARYYYPTPTPTPEITPWPTSEPTLSPTSNPIPAPSPSACPASAET